MMMFYFEKNTDRIYRVEIFTHPNLHQRVILIFNTLIFHSALVSFD